MDVFKTVETIEGLESFLEKNRPPEEIRKELDLSYRIEGSSVIIFELGPFWNMPDEIMECNIAKATYVKSKGYWKVFWQRADLKWHSYSPCTTVKNIKEFVRLVEEDSYGCFWG